MLVLTRKENERIIIGDDVVLTVTRIWAKGEVAKVQLGFTAPSHVRVLREELLIAIAKDAVEQEEKRKQQ